MGKQTGGTRISTAGRAMVESIHRVFLSCDGWRGTLDVIVWGKKGRSVTQSHGPQGGPALVILCSILEGTELEWPSRPRGTFTSLARDFRSEMNNKFMQIPHLVSGEIHTLQPRDRLSFL